MRIVFAGTPEVAVPALRALNESDHEIALVVTRPDAPMGRKRVMTPSPVAQAAEEFGLNVLKTARLDDDATAQIVATDAELGVVVAYGGLVREPLLSGLERGWVNLHFSLLPRWRGAAPVQRALMAGDTELGWAVFQLVSQLDAGGVFVMETFRPDPFATAGDVLAHLGDVGGARLPSIVDAIGAGATAVTQHGDPTHAPKLSLEDGRLDFTTTADEVHARFRGVTPEPGAFITVADARVKVHAMTPAPDHAPREPGEVVCVGTDVVVGTGTFPLRLDRVQPAGKLPMPAIDWWRGLRADRVQAT